MTTTCHHAENQPLGNENDQPNRQCDSECRSSYLSLIQFFSRSDPLKTSPFRHSHVITERTVLLPEQFLRTDLNTSMERTRIQMSVIDIRSFQSRRKSSSRISRAFVRTERSDCQRNGQIFHYHCFVPNGYVSGKIRL